MSAPRALRLYAGARALAQLRRHGALRPAQVGTIAAAAGGPKGLILGPLDRFIFGHWLSASAQPVDLIGASIGAWRLAAACLPDAQAALWALQDGYIHDELRPAPGRRLPLPEQLSASFARQLQRMFGGHEAALLAQRRWRLHLVTARGRQMLAREGRWRTPLGYAGAGLSNLLARRALGGWLQRVVFSSPGGDGGDGAGPAPLPFADDGFPTRQVLLTAANFLPALQASGSIPFALRAVHDIAGAPRGAYWDGGITDYHLHLPWITSKTIASNDACTRGTGLLDAENPALVLYPHFQRQVVPGWLDKHLRWRHRATPALDDVLLLAPDPQWVARLPGGKLPDRSDVLNLPGAERVRRWEQAVAAAQQLADEWADWLAAPRLERVEPL